jgi:hypothetical protein
MGDIVRHVEHALACHSADRIVEARERLVYNFGRATDVAAEQLAGLYRRTRESAQQRPSLWQSVAMRIRVAR